MDCQPSWTNSDLICQRNYSGSIYKAIIPSESRAASIIDGISNGSSKSWAAMGESPNNATDNYSITANSPCGGSCVSKEITHDTFSGSNQAELEQTLNAYSPVTTSKESLDERKLKLVSGCTPGSSGVAKDLLNYTKKTSLTLGSPRCCDSEENVGQDKRFFLPRVNRNFCEECLAGLSKFKVYRESITNNINWKTAREIILEKF